MTDLKRLAEKISNKLPINVSEYQKIIFKSYIESLLSEAMEKTANKARDELGGIAEIMIQKNVKEAYFRAAEVAQSFVQNHMGHAGDFAAGAEVTARKIAAAIEKLKEDR